MTGVAVCGDLNIDMMHHNVSTTDIIDNFESLSYVPFITDITRPAIDGGSCIDHMWTDQLFETKSRVREIDISDHYLD